MYGSRYCRKIVGLQPPRYNRPMPESNFRDGLRSVRLHFGVRPANPAANRPKDPRSNVEPMRTDQHRGTAG
jgi:hypothetical protein